MSLKKFLVSRTFFINLLIAIVIVSAIIFITLQSLKSYTRHGQSMPVPDFSGMLQDEAESVAESYKLKVVVIDSVFNDNVAPGAVVEQQPGAGFGVKENRTIFLTINSKQKEKIVLPKLTEVSFRQAQVLIENCGLLIGNITYQPSEYNDLVLKAEQDSQEVFQGDMLIKGSKIDLVIGRDAENEQTPLPDLKGLKVEEAKSVLTDAMLNLGVIIYDETILEKEDSINAVIWRQRPDNIADPFIKLGTSVDVWITVDEEKIQKATKPEELEADSDQEI